MEQKYKSALEAARKLHGCYCNNKEQRKMIEFIFPELAESEDERIRKAAIAFVKASDHFGYHLGISKENVLSWLEKTSKQESTDEPELGFKVGDWVVQKNGDTFYGGARTVQISKIEDDKIWFTSGTWLTSYYIRHWNIKDAKDGDVLVDVCGNIGIFEKGCGINWHTYCYLGFDGRFIPRCGSHGSICYPATKGQQDYLFKKMREAGYMWDAEKKELKKIAQEPAWSEDDEERFVSCLQRLGTGNMKQPDTINTMWLKSIKNRVQTIAKFVGEEQYMKGVRDSVEDVLKNPEDYGLLPTPS